MRSAPTLRVTDPANAFIAVTVRIAGWREVRRLVHWAGCKLEERRTGLITKRFTVTGDERSLNKFVALAWNSELLGRQFRDKNSWEPSDD